MHFNPWVDPFTRSEDESVSGVGVSVCFTQRESKTELDMDIWRMARVDTYVVTRHGICTGTTRMDDLC